MRSLYNQKKGRLFEEKALAYLQQQDYLLIAQNYRIHGGEIDLIMADGNVLVAVEVKGRCDPQLFMDAITPKKKRLIEQTFEQFLQNTPQCRERYAYFRIDAVLISGQDKIIHLKNVF